MSDKKNQLESKPQSCWDVYTDQAHLDAMDALAKGYVDFLTECKTERETITKVVERIEAAGFKPDFSADACYRVMRNKTIFMARKGKRPLSEGFRLAGAHADTPRLDLKQHPLYETVGLGLAKTHYYGGIRKYQWLGRPLALHGLIALKNGTSVTVCIGEDPNDPVFTIADLLPHLARKQNEAKVSDAFEGEKLNIIIGHAPEKAETDEKGEKKEAKDPVKKQVLTLLNQRYGITEDDLYSAELQVVPAGPARFVGLDSSLIGGYGQDDRSCVYTALEAFLAADQPEHTQIVIFWDKEEIGSDGSTGAKSLFLEYSLQDLIDAWEPGVRLSKVFMASKALSADVHAAIDPDFQDLHEKMNSSLMGYGPVFCKFTGHGGKYMANDAHAEYVGWLRNLFDTAEIPWQMAELGKVDAGGGGTVAKELAIYGMDIIDFGPGILGMHSPFELASKADIYAVKLAFQAFLNS
ncbi:MAG: aminopeptidase [Desulfovibrio sp.]|uniref:aminopeptidase n=1 Tax=Desulfovibrio sp. 7SRBS1 TaxID=3378064 RepID=UPI003B41198B